MRALLFDQPADDGRAARVAEVPVPDPGPGDLSIDVAYAGINFIDVMARRGDRGYVAQWPFTPGLEVAGVVRAVGAGVDGWRPGDRVAAFTARGGLAEVAVARAAVSAHVPPALPLELAAAAPGARPRPPCSSAASPASSRATRCSSTRPPGASAWPRAGSRSWRAPAG